MTERNRGRAVVLAIVLSLSWGCTATSAKPALIGTGLVVSAFGTVMLVDSAPRADDGVIVDTLNDSLRSSGIVFTVLGAAMVIGGLALNPEPDHERGPSPRMEDRRGDAATTLGEAPEAVPASSDPRIIAGTSEPLRLYLADTCLGGDAAACRLLGVGVLRGSDRDPPDPEGARVLFDLACYMGDVAGCSLADALGRSPAP